MKIKTRYNSVSRVPLITALHYFTEVQFVPHRDHSAMPLDKLVITRMVWNM